MRPSSTSARAPLVSATGSTAMGGAVGPEAGPAVRSSACLNSAATTRPSSCPTADLDLTLRGVAFAAMGTAGHVARLLRRLFVHENVYDKLRSAAEGRLRLGPGRQSARGRQPWSAR